MLTKRVRFTEPSRHDPYGGSGCSPQLPVTSPLKIRMYHVRLRGIEHGLTPDCARWQPMSLTNLRLRTRLDADPSTRNTCRAWRRSTKPISSMKRSREAVADDQLIVGLAVAYLLATLAVRQQALAGVAALSHSAEDAEVRQVASARLSAATADWRRGEWCNWYCRCGSSRCTVPSDLEQAAQVAAHTRLVTAPDDLRNLCLRSWP